MLRSTIRILPRNRLIQTTARHVAFRPTAAIILSSKRLQSTLVGNEQLQEDLQQQDSSLQQQIITNNNIPLNGKFII
jgi:hypothetical protein